MLRNKSRLTLAVVLVAATMLVAGGVAVASNTGFKINKPLVVGGAGQIGNNWTSIPYFNPYGNGGTLCTQLGLISTGITRAVLLKTDASTGVSSSANCGTAAAGTFAWTQGQGIRIRNAGTGAPTSAIIVGSHNPAATITIPDAGTGSIGNLWFGVPYHTTAVSAADLCASIGMTSAGVSRGSVGRLNATTGAFTSANCGTAAASTLTLVLGEAVRLREPNGPMSFVPAHF